MWPSLNEETMCCCLLSHLLLWLVLPFKTTSTVGIIHAISIWHLVLEAATGQLQNPDTPGIAGQGSDIRSSARPQKNLAVVGVAYLVLVESASGSDEHYHSKEVREANNSGPNAKASLNRAEFSLSIQSPSSTYSGSGIYRWQFTYQSPKLHCDAP